MPTPRPHEPIWLIRRDAMPKRLRKEGGCLRGAIGWDTLLSDRVQSIDLTQIEEVRILGPYAWPQPPLQLAAITFAAGAAVGTMIDLRTTAILSIAAIALTCIVRLLQNVRQAQLILAQIKAGSQSYFVTYLAEREAEVKALLGNAAWEDRNLTENDHELTAQEENQQARLRISLVMIVTAVSFFVLSFSVPKHSADILASPSDILTYSAIGLTFMTGVLAIKRLIAIRPAR